MDPEDPADEARGPKPPDPYTATHEPGHTDERPDETGRRRGEKGAL